jgi:hypothetical protein
MDISDQNLTENNQNFLAVPKHSKIHFDREKNKLNFWKNQNFNENRS